MENVFFCAVYQISLNDKWRLRPNSYLWIYTLIKIEKTGCSIYTAQKMKFSIKDFFSKCDQIRRKLQIWSHLLKKTLMENFIFCAILDVWRELFHFRSIGHLCSFPLSYRVWTEKDIFNFHFPLESFKIAVNISWSY